MYTTKVYIKVYYSMLIWVYISEVLKSWVGFPTIYVLLYATIHLFTTFDMAS